MTRIDELKAYKELLDTGIITQEEYNAKKQVLLTQPEQVTANTESRGAGSVDSYLKAVTAVPSATGVVGTKSKIVAGLLGILLGVLGLSGFGGHNFYLGKKERAITQLALTIVGFVLLFFVIGYFIIIGVAIWGFVEGILILTSHKGSKWHLDADGNELID